MSKHQESRLEVMASDQITELPNSVFEHILSFLSTKQAITACLLSKSWRHLRLSLPILDFDDFNFHSLHSFLQYVDTVMRMRDDSETLKKFHLTLRSTSGSVPRVNINTWLNIAIDSKVEHFEIHNKTLDKFNIDIPSCIFNCNTITILKLSGVTMTTTLSFVDLPSLKVLHLNKVMFSNITCVYKLLYGCPSLQDLSVKYCSTNYYYKRCSMAPIKEERLKNLLSADDNDNYYPFTLEERLKNLVSADVYHYPFALESLSNVTSLRIDTIGFLRSHATATFYNLIHMEIRYSDFAGTILEYLPNYPKLETLIIHEIKCRELWSEPTYDIPQCLSSHLKEFHLGNFKGLNSEFKFARFIMEKARVLNIISIRRDITLKANSEQEVMFQRLSFCPRGSVNCRLLIN